MRIGIIDLGTNSVRFDVQWIGSRNRVRLLHREKLMVRLGQGVFVNQKLDIAAKRRTIEAFLNFRKIASHFQTSKIIAFGTSALREATDSDSLVRTIHHKTGIDIRVISGEEEAQLIALGILSNEKKVKGRFGLIDIGGGSTEISLCKERTILHSASFPLGTARLQQLFLKTSPPSNSKKKSVGPIHDLRNHIQSALLIKQNSETWPKVDRVIGSSGTIRALERILKRRTNQDGIKRESLAALVEEMSLMTKHQLARVPGMEPKRVDMILAGAILLEECMDSLGASNLSTTHFSLRDGILDREIRHLLHEQGPESKFQLEELYEKTIRFGFPEKVLRTRVKTAELLFDHLQNLHRLDSDWKLYLSASVILHQIGSAISPTHFEAHSYYIVKSADFLAMEKWESEFIAQLCLKYNFSTISKKDISFTRDKNKRLQFVKLLSLLKLADALNMSEKTPIRIEKIRMGNGQLRIILKGRGPSDLNKMKINQKKTLFEETFQIKLAVLGQNEELNSAKIKLS